MHRKVLSLIFLTLFLVCGSVQAQSTQPDDEANLETHLYLLVGTNQDVADSKLPSSLDSVMKQLRATLPFKNYRLAATLINRVKNEGRLNLGWIGTPLVTTISPAQPTTRSSFQLRQIKLVRNSEGQSIVQMTGFVFNASIPLQVNLAAVAANKPEPPIFNYEGTSLSTDVSMREGEPAIVGTLNIGPSGDAVILVVSAKRTSK